VLLVGADRQNWYFVLTHYEIDKWPWTMEKLLEKGEKVF
jgi:hypothetical protein